MRRLTKYAVAVVILAAFVFGIATRAIAETNYESLYGFDRTWNSALRMIRVDMGFKVTEKDEATGYLLFEYKSPESGMKPSSGSMEFVRSKEPDSPVRVVVQLPQMPSYHEQLLVDALARKMRNEYGDPPSHAKRDPVPVADGGAEASTFEY
jgi:hypothetical protein